MKNGYVMLQGVSHMFASKGASTCVKAIVRLILAKAFACLSQ